MAPVVKSIQTLSSPDNLVNDYCLRLEQALVQHLPVVECEPARLHEALRYTTLNGGKRIRACLVYAAGEAFGAPLKTLDVPACAIEIIHSFSLVHDDMPCMDDDDLRRGKPTCHRAFDEATALLVGDALQSLAFGMLANDTALDIDDSRRLRMVGALAQAAGSLGMAGGQAMDVESTGKELDLQALEDMHERKTGELIRAAVRLGALAGKNIDDADLTMLDAYGESIGLAFQIVDDILDITENTVTLGKPQGSDQAQNKPTYPALVGLDEARARADELYKTALASLAPLGDNGAMLRHLAGLIVHRNQ